LWKLHEVTTISRSLESQGWVADLVVDRAGTATMAWAAWSQRADDPLVTRTSDDPPAAGDPQDPPDPPEGQDPLDAQFSASPWSLGIDALGRISMLWLQDLVTPAPESSWTEYYDLVVSDRGPGGGWSASPPVLGTGFVGNAELEVNASGAAVVAWDQFSRNSHVFVSYRPSAGADWTPRERIPRAQWMLDVGIDDRGRALLLIHDPRQSGDGDVKAIVRNPDGHWSKPKRIAGPNSGWAEMVVGPSGAAVVAYNLHDEDRWPDGRLFTSRMSPSGQWSPSRPQPYGLHVPGAEPLGMDGKGRTLLASWEGRDLMVRWSRGDGRWRRPCVLAADVRRPRIFGEVATQVLVNRRGDALVAWRAKGRVQQVWARYKPVGEAWTPPIRVTPAGSKMRNFVSGLSDSGHAAIAWTTRGQLHVRKGSPTQ
jgi:hypothetical protein